MINSGILISPAGRYAKALFQIGEEQKILLLISQELQLFSQLLAVTGEFRVYLLTKTLSQRQKLLLWEECASLLGVTKFFKNFIKLLIDNKRIALVHDIKNIFNQLWDATQGIVRVEVMTALPFSAKQGKQLENFLTKHYRAQVKTQYSIDQNLLAGFIVRHGDTIIDASLSGQLKQLATHTIEA